MAERNRRTKPAAKKPTANLRPATPLDAVADRETGGGGLYIPPSVRRAIEQRRTARTGETAATEDLSAPEARKTTTNEDGGRNAV
jgi:hypothetical protein